MLLLKAQFPQRVQPHTCMGCSLSSTATSTIAMSSDAASSTAASGPPPLRVLLITHNVCGIFDDTSGAARAMWVAEIAALAAEHDADFVALHMQETGGSDWRTNALEGVAPLAAALAAACPEYWSSGVLCNTDTSDESRFTALSCCFLVRRRAGAVAKVPQPHARRASLPSRTCLLYTSPSPRDKRQSRMPSSA